MGDANYRDAAQVGLDFIFEAQHLTGGWPQYFPLRGGYSDAVTFNDDLHINVLRLLEELADEAPPFDVSPFVNDERAQPAIDAGRQCILDAQIQIFSEAKEGLCPARTNWCAQHDRATLAPIAARDYEPASYSGKEGMRVALYLMGLPDPSADEKEAVVGAYLWAKKAVLRDYAKSKDGSGNQVLVYSEGAELWPRFATIPGRDVIFCDRGCVNDESLMYTDYPEVSECYL